MKTSIDMPRSAIPSPGVGGSAIPGGEGEGHFRFDGKPLTIVSRDNGGGEDKAGKSVLPQDTPLKAYRLVVGTGLRPALQRKDISK